MSFSLHKTTTQENTTSIVKGSGKVAGFSMPEIIATLAIVAILMAIAIPAALAQRQKGIESAQRSDLLSAVAGIETVLNAYKGAPPKPVILETDTETSQWTLKLFSSNTVLQDGRASSGTNVSGTLGTLPTGCNAAEIAAQKLAECGGYTESTSPPQKTAIWPNGTYCVQAVNTGSSKPNLYYDSSTQDVQEGTCSGNAPSGGAGVVVEGESANVPGPPTITSLSSPADNTININWAASSVPAGAPAVTSYIVNIDGSEPQEIGTSLTATLNNVPGGPTVLTLRGKNDNGVGPASAPVAVTVNGAVNPPTFTDVSFLNSWSNTGAPYNTAQYAKTSDGMVVLRGLVGKNPSTTASSAVFQLPAGYRPPASLVFSQPANLSATGQANVIVAADGTVTVNSYSSTGNSSNVSLSGITFYVN